MQRGTTRKIAMGSGLPRPGSAILYGKQLPKTDNYGAPRGLGQPGKPFRNVDPALDKQEQPKNPRRSAEPDLDKDTWADLDDYKGKQPPPAQGAHPSGEYFLTGDEVPQDGPVSPAKEPRERKRRKKR